MLYLATMCKNQGNRLTEWILYYNNIGVEKFIIFLDNCTDDSIIILENIIIKYKIQIDIYLTEVFDIKSQELDWISRSHVIYDYVISKYKFLAEWIAFIEVDEFIFSLTEDIKLDLFLKKINTICLYINSWDFKGPFDESKNILGQSYLCWTDEYRFNCEYRWRGKSIIKPKYFNKCMDAHHFRMDNDRVSEEFKHNRDLLQIYHGKEVYIDDNIFRIGHFRNHSPATEITNFINVKELLNM